MVFVRLREENVVVSLWSFERRAAIKNETRQHPGVEIESRLLSVIVLRDE
jgi:hypothetical protein